MPCTEKEVDPYATGFWAATYYGTVKPQQDFEVARESIDDWPIIIQERHLTGWCKTDTYFVAET